MIRTYDDDDGSNAPDALGETGNPEERVDRLTAHQCKIMEMRCLRGMTSEAIASELFVTTQTIKTHFTIIFRKLGIAAGNPSAYMCTLYGMKLATQILPPAYTDAIDSRRV